MLRRLGRAVVKLLPDGEPGAGIGDRNSLADSGDAGGSQSNFDDYSYVHRAATATAHLPYNVGFEVAKENLIVDFDTALGSSEFGFVFKGHIKLESSSSYISASEDETTIPVAVKTARRNLSHEQFKQLLSELKLLAYVEHHQHVAKLIGAYTANIRNKEIYIAVELCTGSLHKFLRDNTTTFKNLVNPTTGLLLPAACIKVGQNEDGVTGSLTTFDLIRWAAEIATGMEFLAQKRVVHIDLAARNVLLSFDHRAKISDFKLAQAMPDFDYSYVMTEKRPLPWKWMAPESLTRMKFSTASDVWSFGVTCWEIFSLGADLFPGMMWSFDFVEQLIHGLRLDKPQFTTQAIFNNMLECWHVREDRRPTFAILKEFFQEQRKASGIACSLTDEQVTGFLEGQVAGSATGFSGCNFGQPAPVCFEEHFTIECLPYNCEFEVPREKLFLDFGKKLGSGQYGVVFKGHIRQEQQNGATASIPRHVPVAVKTVRPNVPIEYVMALMSELKILAYIGQHENVANLIGACSSNVKNRELYVGVELCAGSLLQFLRDNQDSFRTFVDPSTGSLTAGTCLNAYQNHDLAKGSMTTFDLIRWCAEIATGMEFLAMKRVVHADLAARNVLLSFDMHAKICDFGLARKLVEYSYTKSWNQDCRLPIKWMAIESLRQLKFTVASDVWSYGVTCWEIFTLGDIPYTCFVPGWSELMGQLVVGERLPKPQYANVEIHEKMLECWREKKEERPKFSDLKEFFHGQMNACRPQVNV